MAKKGFGKFVAFAAISGAVAAGVSYVRSTIKSLIKISVNLKRTKKTRTLPRVTPLIPVK